MSFVLKHFWRWVVSKPGNTLHHDWLRPLCCGVACEVPTSVPFDFHVSRQQTSLLPNFWSLMQDRSVGGALQAISRVIAISHPLLCPSHSCQSPTNIPTSEFLVSDAMAVSGRALRAISHGITISLPRYAFYTHVSRQQRSILPNF